MSMFAPSKDHTSIHRALNSLNNSVQHLQPGLVKHLQIRGLSDDFLNVHANNVVMYSRITPISRFALNCVIFSEKVNQKSEDCDILITCCGWNKKGILLWLHEARYNCKYINGSESYSNKVIDSD